MSTQGMDDKQRLRETERLLIDRAERGSVGVERFDDRDDVIALIEQTTARVKRELCSTLPAGPYPLSMLMNSWDTDTAMIKRGISMPVIYQSDAARKPEVLHYLADFVAAGAKVRVAPRVPHRTILVDRETVLVAVREDSLGVPFLLVREPAMVRNFCAQFAMTWRRAHPVGVGPEDSLADETVREILAVLRTGVTDEVAARQLHVSARTIRRRVAAVLDLLGASSRFDAGVKAVEAGWL